MDSIVSQPASENMFNIATYSKLEDIVDEVGYDICQVREEFFCPSRMTLTSNRSTTGGMINVCFKMEDALQRTHALFNTMAVNAIRQPIRHKASDGNIFHLKYDPQYDLQYEAIN